MSQPGTEVIMPNRWKEVKVVGLPSFDSVCLLDFARRCAEPHSVEGLIMLLGIRQ